MRPLVNVSSTLEKFSRSKLNLPQQTQELSLANYYSDAIFLQCPALHLIQIDKHRPLTESGAKVDRYIRYSAANHA